VSLNRSQQVILITTDCCQEARAVLGSLSEVLDTEDIGDRATDVFACLVGLSLRVDLEFLGRFRNLQYVLSPTTGLNHVDLHACSIRGVEIIYLDGADGFLDSITSTSELTLGLILALVRRIPRAVSSVTAGEWTRDCFSGVQLSGLTVGIIGLGRIGRHLASYCAALRMDVLAFDPYLPNQDVRGLRLVDSICDLAADSDIISLHARLSPETSGLMDRSVLRHAKTGAYLINTARGELLDEVAVVESLEKGVLAGVAVDVLANEMSTSARASSPLVVHAKTHDNVLITPHIGGMTPAARSATDVYIANRFRERLREKWGE
jgi:D-3-phosphoglycerate dehydrogenase / 2-oxoglutarate reductase